MPILILARHHLGSSGRREWSGCAADGGRLPPGSVKLNAGVWIPPHSVTAQSLALCLCAFLGQDDHRTAGTRVQARRQTPPRVITHLKVDLCAPDTQEYISEYTEKRLNAFDAYRH